jgi:hypothetical protein
MEGTLGATADKSDLDDRESIKEYVKAQYRKEREVPTVATILSDFKVSRKQFYRIFPKGLTQLCFEATVPTPGERVQKTRTAIQAKRRTSEQRNKPVERRETAGVLLEDKLAALRRERETDERRASLSKEGMVVYTRRYLRFVDPDLFAELQAKHQTWIAM